MALCCNVFKTLCRTKTLDISNTESQFKRCLTTLDLTILGMGTMMGSGLYVLTGVVAKETAGPAVILSYVIAGLVSIMAAMCYSEFGSRVPVTGSAYTYTYVTIGELWGFVIGWNLVLEYVVGGAAVARSFSGYFDELIGYRLSNFTKNVIFGGHTYDIPYFAAYPDLFSGILVMFVVLIVIFGANVSARCLNVMVSVNLVVVTFVFVSGLFLGDVRNWSDFFPFGFAGAFSGAASCFFAFSGFDVIALSSEEAIDHEKGVPRATGLSILFAGLSYVAVSVSLTLMVPYDEIYENAAFSHALAYHGVVWAKYVVGIGALCGMFTSLLGTVFSLPRSIYAMANDGLLFTFLAKVSKRTQVPVIAAVIFGLLSAIMAVLFDLSALVEFMSIGVLMAYAIVAGAVIVLRYRPSNALKGKSHSPAEVASPHSSDSDEEDESLAAPQEGATDEELIDTLEREGSLKRQFRFLTFLADREPGQVVCICLFLTVIFQTLVVVVGVAAWDRIEMGDWWAILLMTSSIVLTIVTFIPIPMHNQTTNGRGYNVPLVPYVPMVSIFCDIVLMVMLKPVTWLRFAIWVGIGLLVYGLYGYCHSVEGRQRVASTDKQKYKIISDSGVPSPLALYGTIALQQPKSSEEETDMEKESPPSKTEL
ncbi:cationic amino acid transporter 4-like [Patiria miniata]|uniref:Cationic amino acid transporter C-terminal domain-containing protein n=1 Tax=Patiria miniata TaxID=46514 RepID=A0A914BPC3_PATMI|nr:cationic amino acid transporter 4-like [Patiria miniata]XP_038077811.1 cationic amino acid transporter 4-like [Patiria miniata]